MKKVQFNINDKLDFQAAEAFKILRTNIGFCGNNIKVISFTSCASDEGKSSVSFRNALSFAEAGKKVLFIDADIRNSVFVHRYQVSETTYGLTHYLSGQKTMDEIVYDTNKENFHMIFTGAVAPNPTELLGGEMFRDLLKWARENYEYVFIDCPPLGSVIDAAIIAQYCDGAILVIESNAISYHFAQKVKGQLEKSGCHILGAILNKVDISKRGYYGKYGKYGKYGYGYYGYGNTASEEKKKR